MMPRLIYSIPLNIVSNIVFIYVVFRLIHRFLLKLYTAKVDITFENYNSNYVSKVGIAFFMVLFCSVCKEIEWN